MMMMMMMMKRLGIVRVDYLIRRMATCMVIYGEDGELEVTNLIDA